MIVSLDAITLAELIAASAMVLPITFFCFWQKRPFGLWIIHSLLIQYLCLYWIPMAYVRVVIGLVATMILILATERRVNSGL